MPPLRRTRGTSGEVAPHLRILSESRVARRRFAVALKFPSQPVILGGHAPILVRDLGVRLLLSQRPGARSFCSVEQG